MATTAYAAPFQTTDLDEMARILNLPAFDTDKANGNGNKGNGRRCPYFASQVPDDWHGCGECGIAQACYDAWVQSQSAPTDEES
jgi:hypothetical protein